MPSLRAVLRGAASSGPYAAASAKAHTAVHLYIVVAAASIVTAVAADSLAMRLNAFMALHGVMVLIGALLGVAARGEGAHGKAAVLAVLGLSSESDSKASGGCGGGDHTHSHSHSHGGCGGGSDPHDHGHGHSHGHGGGCGSAAPTLKIDPQCREAFPSDLSRIPLLFQFAADVIVFFTAFSTVVEAVQRVGHSHAAAPAPAHLIVSAAHALAAVYHYNAVVRWVGEGGRRSPFSSATPQAGSARHDAAAMVLSPVVCAVGGVAAALTGHAKMDVLVALLLSVYCGQWALRRLTAAAFVLAARSPLVSSSSFGSGGGGGGASSTGGGNGTPVSPFGAAGDNTSNGGGPRSALGVAFHRALLDTRMVRGVLEVRRHSVWPITSAAMGAHIHVVLSRDGDEATVGAAVRNIFGGFVSELVVECERQSMPTAMAIGSAAPSASVASASAPHLFPASPLPSVSGHSLPPPPALPTAAGAFGLPPAPALQTNGLNLGGVGRPTTGGGLYQLPPPPALPVPSAPFPFPRAGGVTVGFSPLPPSEHKAVGTALFPPAPVTLPPAPTAPTSAAAQTHAV